MGNSAALTLDGYIRVSQVKGRSGDSFISPAQQADRINQWASAYGHRIDVLHEELDESGARADRPQLLAAIERVERGEINGIVVAKLDRFARSLVDGLRLIERIREAGGTFVSVADGLDLTTDTGRLVLRIMLSLAEFELDRVRGNWSDAKSRAVARGIHPSAWAPFGYRREGRGGPLLPDPVNATIVTELYARRLAGAGPAELSDWLASIGAVTQRGRETWSERAIKEILRNRVYLGEAFSGENRNPNAHEALVDPQTFEAVQYRGVQFRPKTEHPSPIRPLLRCAGCRYSMRAERRALKDGDVWYFTCKAAGGPRVSWRCEEPAAIKDDGSLERMVVERFFDELPRLEARGRSDTPRLAKMERKLGAAQAAFEQWRADTRIQDRVGMDTYLDGLADRQDALNLALAEVAQERVHLGAVTLPASATAIRERWDTFSPADQRDLLRSGFRAVFVRGSSRTAPLPGRLRFVTVDDAVEIPHQGHPWTPIPVPFD